MRPAIAVVVAVAALVVVALASAKEGARARLTTTLPLGAAPGTMLQVRWTVATPDGSSGRPFAASGMFVRLLSKTGASATTGFAGGSVHADGRYAAKVRVPPGGIGGLRAGLRGWNNVGDTGGFLFPVENDPSRHQAVFAAT